MPICKQCNKQFPNLMKINGVKKSLCNRKYCIDCSPWGMHNTKSFSHVRVLTQERECRICQKPYQKKGSMCQSCATNMRRYKIKIDSINYLGGVCSSCGYDKCIGAMVFHHINPDEKDFAISHGYTHSWEAIKIELDKCILLCQNCHAELHWNEVDDKRQLMLSRLK